jgi:transcriptional antiterminator RfaH
VRSGQSFIGSVIYPSGRCRSGGACLQNDKESPPVKPGANTPAVDQWYAVYCQPLRERQAAVALEYRLGLATYLPEIRRRFRGQVQQAPLFPRYLFVRADLYAAAPSRINATPGVLRLVAFGETPQPIPAAAIEALCQQVEQLNAQGGLPEHGFHPGDPVLLASGPLQGLAALFVGPTTPSERVRVLVDFLGSLREVDVHVETLEKPNVPVVFRRERGTRGKGRRIKQHKLRMKNGE